jgi:hypothetical protein
MSGDHPGDHRAAHAISHRLSRRRPRRRSYFLRNNPGLPRRPQLRAMDRLRSLRPSDRRAPQTVLDQRQSPSQSRRRPRRSRSALRRRASNEGLGDSGRPPPSSQNQLRHRALHPLQGRSRRAGHKCSSSIPQAMRSSSKHSPTSASSSPNKPNIVNVTKVLKKPQFKRFTIPF